MLIRLQKHIANLGICSRRKAEKLIADGKIKINGEIAKLGAKIDPKLDKIIIDKNEIDNKKSKNIYIILNKPVGYISSASNKQGESVLDLLIKQNCVGKNKININTRVYPVGRLDKDSEGLVLLTNDGGFTNQLTHPKFEHEKEYEVTIEKQLSKDAKKVLQIGMKIGDDFVQGIKIKKEFNKGKRTIITVILKEGKNRQIRKMFGNLGYHVQSLKRTRLNNLKLGVLPIGKWKIIEKKDII